MFSDYKAFLRKNFFQVLLIAIMAFITLWGFFASANAHAQGNTQNKDCSAGCDFAADFPNGPGSGVACILAGVGTTTIKTPIIDSATIVPKPPGAVFTAKTCWWPKVIVLPGQYSATATAVNAEGKESTPSDPLALTVPQPIPATPGMPRIVPAQ